MEKRINTETGKTEYKIAPHGLPELWVAFNFCDRCKKFEECLDFKTLTEEEWKATDKIIGYVGSCSEFVKERNVCWSNSTLTTQPTSH